MITLPIAMLFAIVTTMANIIPDKIIPDHWFSRRLYTVDYSNCCLLDVCVYFNNY